MAQHGPNRADLDALKDGAAMLSAAGNRVAALSLLWSAVAIDPLDLAAHRRLAATLASGGDLDGAAEEFARYIEFVLPLGDVNRATLELAYAVNMLGGHDALRGAAEKVADAVRALVPSTNTALPAPDPIVAQLAALAPEPEPEILPAARLLPKVPFRFCLHPAGDKQWMQLEGGSEDLVPEAIRVIDANEDLIDERLVLPLARNSGHVPGGADAPAVAWVVLSIPDQLATAYEVGQQWSCTFQARVNGEWLALDLVDSGCRLGKIRSLSAS